MLLERKLVDSFRNGITHLELPTLLSFLLHLPGDVSNVQILIQWLEYKLKACGTQERHETGILLVIPVVVVVVVVIVVVFNVVV
jgi:hypothetical protein